MKNLSWWDKILNYFEDFEQKWRFVVVPELLIGVYFIFWLIHEGRDRFGDLLPDPVNVFDHIGNVDSVIPALMVGSFVGFVLSRTINLSKKRLKWIAVASGVTFGLLCNILIEIPWGMKFLNEPNVSDPLDVVWGTTFCLLMLWIVFRVRRKNPIP
jgi:hypothetical protein